MRRMWAHEIPIFVPRPRGIAHPGSASAQSLLRIFQACSPLLPLITIFSRLRCSILNCFNSSRVGQKLVPFRHIEHIAHAAHKRDGLQVLLNRFGVLFICLVERPRSFFSSSNQCMKMSGYLDGFCMMASSTYPR